MSAIPATVPAPVGGLNARDALSAMPPTDAVELENWFPDTASVITRLGHEQFADGTALFNPAGFDTSGLRQLAVWSAGTTASKLFAVMTSFDTGTSRYRWQIYEVSTGGTFTSSEGVVGGTTLIAGELGCGEHTMFVPGSTTPYLIMRFGDGDADYTRAYDGSAWSTPSITGLPTLGCLGLNAHQKRLWFYGKDLTAYYLPTGAIAGAVTAYELGLFFGRGGRIVSMRTWAIDGGDGGTDDLAVFLTDRGQAAVFSGTDPSSASTWQLIGVFDVGKVASAPSTQSAGSVAAIRGGSFMLKYGADTLMLLADGVMSAGKILRPSNGQSDYSISGKINTLIRDAAATYGLDGSAPITLWTMTFHSKLKQLLVNIPTGAAADTSAGRATSIQYVMNTETGAWTKFTNMGYTDAVIWNGNMFMVANGYYVYRYGTVFADIGAAIVAPARQAFNYFQSPGNKHFTMLRPNLRIDGNLSYRARCGVDFAAETISTLDAVTASSSTVLKRWASANKIGACASAQVKVSTTVGRAEWLSTDWAIVPGGIL